MNDRGVYRQSPPSPSPKSRRRRRAVSSTEEKSERFKPGKLRRWRMKKWKGSERKGGGPWGLGMGLGGREMGQREARGRRSEENMNGVGRSASRRPGDGSSHCQGGCNSLGDDGGRGRGWDWGTRYTRESLGVRYGSKAFSAPLTCHLYT